MRFYCKSRQTGREDAGYVLLTLLLIMSLMVIAMGIILPTITFEIKRDREEEMVHRGVQYSRAIRAYYKKFNRYPAKIEDLENTNQMRFLRKRYKDPLTGKDFKLLHFGEVKMSAGSMIQGAMAVGANGALMPNAAGGIGQPGQGGLNQAINATVAGAVAANMAAQGGQSGTIPGATSLNGSDAGADDNSQKPGQNSGDANSGQPGNLNGNSGDKLSSTTFGGAPIVGVASVSKDRSIREYDKKRQYNQWQFVYDPTLDRGFLITTPYQPSLQMFGAGPQNVNGTGATGQNGTNSGPSSSFGNSPSPMQSNPTSPAPGGNYGSQPSSSPQQQ
jgi:type II secretory pathway pseudopilin PulG